MFSLNPSPARMRWRHASFWRSVSSTPIGAIACGLKDVSVLATATNLRDHPDRIVGLPGLDVLDGIAVEDAVAVLGDVPEVGAQHGVRRRAERMVDRQRLDAEHVEPSA